VYFLTKFTGRILQVIEALDVGDAVSNHVLELHGMLKEMGFDSHVLCQWIHPQLSHVCEHISSVELSDRDVVISHYAGYSEFAIPYVLDSNATRILHYHNITPHQFFHPSSEIYAHCKKGREQLAQILPKFHFFWGDSQYNVDELISLGADKEKSKVVSIIVPSAPLPDQPIDKEKGAWIFLGRVAANKRHDELLDMFLRVRKACPDAASHLYIVGGGDRREPFYRTLLKQIEKRGASDLVTITGKVSEDEKERYLRKAGLYVSLSRHEGFGVPLVEAPLRDTPTLALQGSAVGETMGNVGVAKDVDELVQQALRVASEPNYRSSLLKQQRKNALRFTRNRVRELLADALRDVVPQNNYQTISLVICTYNRLADLQRCLDYLASQSNPFFEVIVVDGPSTDGTKEFLRKWHGRIKIAENPERNLSISRNLGAEIANGDIVAYIDDDAIPFADWTATLLREFNSRPLTTAALGGPAYFAGTLKFQDQDIGFTKFAEAIPNIDSNRVGRNEIYRSLLGTNTAFSRRALAAVGGFDEQFDYFLDESELTFRLQRSGYKVAYCPDLYVRHEFARSENRTGKYSFNWYSICKNTAYFVALNSDLKGKKLAAYLKERFSEDRVEYLENGYAHGEIDEDVKERGVADIWRGMKQGLADSQRGPLTRNLKNPPGKFLPFPTNASSNRVGIDVKRLHVCIVSKEFPTFGASGGVGTLYYHLASELLLLGHEVTVIMPGDADNYDQGRFHIRYISWEPVDFGADAPETATNMALALRAAKAVAELNRERTVDIIESALWDTQALALALVDPATRPPLVIRLVTPFAVAARTNGWPVSEQVKSQYMEAERTLITKADQVIAISRSIAHTISNEYEMSGSEKWQVSHCGVAYWPFFSVNSGYGDFHGLDVEGRKIDEFDRVILFLGRLEGRKGIETFLHAVPKILRADKQSCVVIAGEDVEGWQDKSKQLLNGCRDRVFFLGPVSDIIREKLFARSYCLVFPSQYESFGLVPLEAFVHGLPVVAANAGAIPEVVSDGVSGRLFPPGDSDALADEVTKLLENPDYHQELSKGAKIASRHFSGKNTAIRSVNMYLELLRR
jgi:glycosyltransferase involved in cell wall biosynthesis/GT2 family glycosyltransferase